MLSCTLTYSERVRKSYSLSKEELFSFKFNCCFNPNQVFKMTGTVGALGSSHVFSPLSYYFPYKNMAEKLLVRVFREKTKSISQKIKIRIFDWQLKTPP